LPSVGDARNIARQSMTKARSGINPVEERREQQAVVKTEAAANAFTFAKLADLFINQYAARKQKRTTLYQTQRLLNRAMLFWSDKPVRDIKKGDVLELLDSIAAKRQRVWREGSVDQPLTEARAVQVCLTTLFRWAMAEDHIALNPMVGIRSDRFGKVSERERVLTNDEIRAFWSAMDEVGWPYGPIGKLLLLTLQREGEVAGLRWSELNNAIWNLPAERAKNGRSHIIHLSEQALSIINALPRINGDLMFPSSKEKPVTGFQDIKRKVDDLMRAWLGRLDHWTWHDLRRSATTGMASELRIAPHVVDKILNHSSVIRGVAAIYNRSAYLEERQQALVAWGRYVEYLVTPRTDNVVDMRRLG